ncbi:MAG TPA: hypothetical protein DCM28_08990 [Phycisphaerales bacterium]|nr:hypothetical protein [Phycisphaerales bacterium]HCD33261.1 hypothetical protein [Phycisphaerales bacterium]|tara:strand:+ start:1785 stop:2405 length:621 start_codon:yes stop_codon:yes gene_type:complete
MNNSPRIVTHARPFVLLAMVGCLCILSGCGDEDIEIYDAPRPAIASSPAHDPNDGHDHSGHDHAQPQAPAQTKAPGEFAYLLPEGWKQAEPGRMVLHSLATSSGATVNISAFPGDVGGVVMNVNRWRGQLGLDANSPDQIQAALTEDKLGSIAAKRVDLSNDTQRMIVSFGMVDGKTWFVKLTGTAQQIDTALPAYDQFLKSVNWK